MRRSRAHQVGDLGMRLHPRRESRDESPPPRGRDWLTFLHSDGRARSGGLGGESEADQFRQLVGRATHEWEFRKELRGRLGGLRHESPLPRIVLMKGLPI